MSLEALKEYGRRCLEEPELRRKAKDIGISNVQGQMEHARSLGLEWDTGDMAAWVRETGADTELSEEQLEGVAGGFFTVTAAVVCTGVAAGVATGVAVGAAVGVGVAAGVTTAAGGW
jgi:hypothetical protein